MKNSDIRWLSFFVLVLSLVFVSCGNTDDEDGSGSSNTSGKHAYVDLGLPSGTKWATCNIGAKNERDYGGYYAWGESATKQFYRASTYKYYSSKKVGDSYVSGFTKYVTPEHEVGLDGYYDNVETLESSDDAATVLWGSDWRMPTYIEADELISECTWTWVAEDAGCGYRITGKNGNSIFLPMGGFYRDGELVSEGLYGSFWTSSLRMNYSNSAYCVFYTGTNIERGFFERYMGRNIRPVYAGK